MINPKPLLYATLASLNQNYFLLQNLLNHFHYHFISQTQQITEYSENLKPILACAVCVTLSEINSEAMFNY